MSTSLYASYYFHPNPNPSPSPSPNPDPNPNPNPNQVSTSLYASYYFQLRTLCQRENNGQEPALKPMDMEKAQALEARGLSKTAELKKSAGKTWQSANDVDSSAAGGLGSLAGAAMRGPL